MASTLKKFKPSQSEKPPKREQADALEFTTGDKPLRVDREKGIIYNVHVLGVESKNRRTYPLPVQAKARPLYEGVSVNISHPPRGKETDDRPFETLFGALRGANTEDGTRADLHYIKSHPLAEMVCEAAERFPENFGLSHNAHVDWLVKDDGHRVCESINSVRSVDVVCRPATTNGIFESEQPTMTMDPSQDTADALQPAGGNGAPAAETPADEVDAHCQMFLDGAKKIFDGEGDVADKVKRIAQLAKTILTNEDTIDAAVNGDRNADDDDDDDDDTGAKESVKERRRQLKTELATAREKLAGFERREKARDALEAAKVEATGARITAVAALESESDRKALIDEFLKVKVAQPAETPAPVQKTKPKSVPANTLESQRDKPADALPNGLKPLTREQLAASVHTQGNW
jgi:hypothetical protein